MCRPNVKRPTIDTFETAPLLHCGADCLLQLVECRGFLQERVLQLAASLRAFTHDLTNLCVTGSITLCSREVATPRPVLL